MIIGRRSFLTSVGALSVFPVGALAASAPNEVFIQYRCPEGWRAWADLSFPALTEVCGGPMYRDVKYFLMSLADARNSVFRAMRHDSRGEILGLIACGSPGEIA